MPEHLVHIVVELVFSCLKRIEPIRKLAHIITCEQRTIWDQYYTSKYLDVHMRMMLDLSSGILLCVIVLLKVSFIRLEIVMIIDCHALNDK